MTRRAVTKGARGEREWVAVLQRHGFEARRLGYLQKYGRRVPDVTTLNAPITWEVKRTERGFAPVYRALEQARCQQFGHLGAVAARSNGKPWIVCFLADDLLRLLADGLPPPPPPTGGLFTNPDTGVSDV